MVNIGIGTAGLAAFLGYLVDFVGIILLMLVIVIMGSIMGKSGSKKKNKEVVDLGSINVPQNMDPKKTAVLLAALAEEERIGRVNISANSSVRSLQPKLVAAIAAAIAEEEEA